MTYYHSYRHVCDIIVQVPIIFVSINIYSNNKLLLFLIGWHTCSQKL